MHVVLKTTAAHRHILKGVAFEVDTGTGCRAGRILDHAAFDQHVGSADDADALAMVVVDQAIFDDDVFAPGQRVARHPAEIETIAATRLESQSFNVTFSQLRSR